MLVNPRPTGVELHNTIVDEHTIVRELRVALAHPWEWITHKGLVEVVCSRIAGARVEYQFGVIGECGCPTPVWSQRVQSFPVKAGSWHIIRKNCLSDSHD